MTEVFFNKSSHLKKNPKEVASKSKEKITKELNKNSKLIRSSSNLLTKNRSDSLKSLRFSVKTAEKGKDEVRERK